MKTQNTPENKAKFFAQYWGLSMAGRKGFLNRTVSDLTYIDEYDYLYLKPLYQITDEDAKAVAKIAKWNTGAWQNKLIEAGRALATLHWFMEVDEDPKNYIHVFDFLRSKGYLLPWRDLSAEEILEYGWAKYNEQ